MDKKIKVIQIKGQNIAEILEKIAKATKAEIDEHKNGEHQQADLLRHAANNSDAQFIAECCGAAGGIAQVLMYPEHNWKIVQTESNEASDEICLYTHANFSEKDSIDSEIFLNSVIFRANLSARQWPYDNLKLTFNRKTGALINCEVLK